MADRPLGIPVFDADNHLYETQDAFKRHLPKRYDGLIEYVTVRGRTKIAIKVKSLMNLLAVQQMPRRLYQAACTHIFGDAMCGFNRASLATTQSALAGSNQAQIVTGLTPSPTTLYDQGTIIGLSGANAGQTRTIAQLSGGTVALLQAWLYPVATGDTFQLLPGCDHTTTTCQNTFNNLARFGGFPYIPPPELAV